MPAEAPWYPVPGAVITDHLFKAWEVVEMIHSTQPGYSTVDVKELLSEEELEDGEEPGFRSMVVAFKNGVWVESLP